MDEATLAGIARARGLPLATDLGSGALVDMAAYGLPRGAQADVGILADAPNLSGTP